MKEIAILTTSSVSAYPPLVMILNPDSDIDTIPERIVRTPTIDGSAVLYSLGKTDADRTFLLITEMDRQTADTLNEMRNNYSDFSLSLPDGVYHGMIQDVKESGGMQITFLTDGKI